MMMLIISTLLLCVWDCESVFGRRSGRAALASKLAEDRDG